MFDSKPSAAAAARPSASEKPRGSVQESAADRRSVLVTGAMNHAKPEPKHNFAKAKSEVVVPDKAKE